MIKIITDFLGISALRLYIYAALVVLVVIAGGIVRQHYVNAGWRKAMERVQRQDDAAVAAARKVDKRATTCSDSNGYWDVITQGCKLGDDQ